MSKTKALHIKIKAAEIFFIVHEELFYKYCRAQGSSTFQFRHNFKRKNPRRCILRGFLGGVTGNRTRDTRIFSPLLYQLSYDTIVLECKDRIFILISKIFLDNYSELFLWEL